MKPHSSLQVRAKRLCRKCAPVILVLQKTPVSQIVVQEARVIGTTGLSAVVKWSVATVAGLGAFDTVTGATTLTQIAPSRGSSTVPATVGEVLSFIVQVTGAPSTAGSWQVLGTLPAGLKHQNATNSNTDSITGVPTQSGTFPITVKAWEDRNFRGGSKSKTFTITVAGGEPPPTVTTQPISSQVNVNGTVTLNVGTTGTSPAFQWYVGNSGDTSNPVSGATGASFTTPALTATTSYWVKVSTAAGSVNSSAAVVTVIAPPEIATQPGSVTIDSGGTATLTVAAAGASPAFQWYQGDTGDDSNPVVDATGASFTTPALDVTTNYWVRVSNSSGSVDSDTVVVTVTVPQTDPFVAWQAGIFSAAQLADALISGATANPDGDSLTNEEEYVFGTSPLIPQMPVAPSITFGAGEVSISFTASPATGPGYSGLQRHYALESCATSDLASDTWGVVPDFTDIIGTGQVVTLKASMAVPSTYYRMKVWLSPGS
ncbi:MAG: hypothetical protein R3F19_19210 [Verrucomicrobiales bacterium]